MQPDQLGSSNHKKQEETYSVDKNKIQIHAKIKERKRKLEEKKNNQIVQEAIKQICIQPDKKHAYLSLPYGMIYFSPEQIQYQKETYEQRSYLGIPEYSCQYCNAIFWYEERSKYHSERANRQVLYSNCCKYGKIRIPPFKEPPQFLRPHHPRCPGPQNQDVHRKVIRCTRHCNSTKSDTLLVTLLLQSI
jgi:hypothetical protein